jgi:proteic killer suppression protein
MTLRIFFIIIKTSKCRNYCFNSKRVRRFQSFERQARKRLMVLHAAPSPEALMLNPGNKFHALKGDRKGQFAISINKQWRICFEWHDGNAFNVGIVNGKRSITADTALRLQRYFGIEAQFRLNLQTEYDLRIMKRKVWSDIEQRIIPIKTTQTELEHTTGA